eukprot:11170747-Lingulodinium_polyedra.AAC.1
MNGRCVAYAWPMHGLCVAYSWVCIVPLAKKRSSLTVDPVLLAPVILAGVAGVFLGTFCTLGGCCGVGPLRRPKCRIYVARAVLG